MEITRPQQYKWILAGRDTIDLDSNIYFYRIALKALVSFTSICKYISAFLIVCVYDIDSSNFLLNQFYYLSGFLIK